MRRAPAREIAPTTACTASVLSAAAASRAPSGEKHRDVTGWRLELDAAAATARATYVFVFVFPTGTSENSSAASRRRTRRTCPSAVPSASISAPRSSVSSASGNASGAGSGANASDVTRAGVGSVAQTVATHFWDGRAYTQTRAPPAGDGEDAARVEGVPRDAVRGGGLRPRVTHANTREDREDREDISFSIRNASEAEAPPRRRKPPPRRSRRRSTGRPAAEPAATVPAASVASARERWAPRPRPRTSGASLADGELAQPADLQPSGPAGKRNVARPRRLAGWREDAPPPRDAVAGAGDDHRPARGGGGRDRQRAHGLAGAVRVRAAHAHERVAVPDADSSVRVARHEQPGDAAARPGSERAARRVGERRFFFS